MRIEQIRVRLSTHSAEQCWFGLQVYEVGLGPRACRCLLLNLLACIADSRIWMEMRQRQIPHGCHIETEERKAHNICMVNPDGEDHEEAQNLISAYKTDCL